MIQIDTGIFGTYVLVHWLFDHGFDATAYELLVSEEPKCSFHYMKECGATTLWEDWDGRASYDHPMFGGAADVLFENILGIRMTVPGWTAAEIQPRIPDELEWVRGHITVPAGEIRVDFNRSRPKQFVITAPDMEITFRGVSLKPGENLCD